MLRARIARDACPKEWREFLGALALFGAGLLLAGVVASSVQLGAHWPLREFALARSRLSPRRAAWKKLPKCPARSAVAPQCRGARARDSGQKYRPAQTRTVFFYVVCADHPVGRTRNFAAIWVLACPAGRLAGAVYARC